MIETRTSQIQEHQHETAVPFCERMSKMISTVPCVAYVYRIKNCLVPNVEAEQ
jgi:hypothetical protein